MHTLAVLHWLPSPSQHFLVVAVALLVYVVNARARRERRAPAAAIAWVMGLALLPYLVLPLYLAFGHRKIKGPLPQARAVAGDSQDWAGSLLAAFGIEAAAPATVRFHADGMQARESLWRLIEAAREQLDVCVFLIGDDALGREAVARLAARARAGVRVRLMYDGMGHWVAPRKALRELVLAGAQVAVFRPLFAPARIGPRNLRNHRKLAVADGRLLWAGGRNLAAEYFDGGPGGAWFDLSFDIEGPVAATAARQFERDWHAASGHGLVAHASGPPDSIAATPVQGASLAQFLPSGPDQAEDTAHALLVTACFRAQRRVLAITPYFVPDASLQQALRLAALRGVQVTLVLPARSNHPLADFVRGRPLRELAQAGVRVLLLPVMSHAKAVVMDDAFAVSGSFNLDARSLLLNYEAGVVFHGEAEIQWLAAWIEARAAQGHAFDARPPGLLRDLAEGLLLAIAFQV
jgi:cardiolipin synthase